MKNKIMTTKKEKHSFMQTSTIFHNLKSDPSAINTVGIKVEELALPRAEWPLVP